MKTTHIKNIVHHITRERVLLLCLIAVYTFIGTGLPGVDTAQRKVMHPLFTVKDTVTAQFDQIFNEKVSDEEIDEVTGITVSTGPDFTKRFAQRLIAQYILLEGGCTPYVKQGETSLEQGLMRLSTFCLVDDAEKYATDSDYGNIMVSKAEFLKYIIQLEVLHTDNEIDLYEYQEGTMPYSDVKQDRWYTPYVYNALQQGLLEGIGEGTFFSKKLQPLGPVSRDEFTHIVENAGHDLPSTLPVRLGGTEYVTKSGMIRFLNVLYDKKLTSADTLYGNNSIFYEWIIERTMKKTAEEQEIFVQEFIDGFKILPASKMDEKYSIQSKAMITFLESLVTE